MLLAGQLPVEREMVDKGVQVRPKGASVSPNLWANWTEQGRATFRPPSSEVGRPTYFLDAEEAESRLRQLRQELNSANEERDGMRAKVVKYENKLKEKDKFLAQILQNRVLHLPSKFASMVKECLASDVHNQLEEAKITIGELKGKLNIAQLGRESSMQETALVAGSSQKSPASSPRKSARSTHRYCLLLLLLLLH